ncbi:MAG: dephospho-CoA kinase [Acidimicrobiia bacterium]|nr:MAG: dephospho-CoA kinase [Acidimicrobiia bacterium]
MGLDGPNAAHVLLGGGIGAGKSTVAEIFVQDGFHVIDADEIGAEILGPGADATRLVAQQWPAAVSNGIVNRRALAQIVFADEDELRQLESITHPGIAAEIARRVAERSGDVVVEIPLQHLVLSGNWFKIAVVAEEEIRIARAVARGGDISDVRRRVSSQVSNEEWADWSDTVIDNSGAWAETLSAVRAVIDEVRK